MWYAIQCMDVANSLERRKESRPPHLARLQELCDAGRLMLAGPFPAIDNEAPGLAGFTGSLIVAEFTDLATAKAWAESDPYVTAGVYATVQVRPFKRVLP